MMRVVIDTNGVLSGLDTRVTGDRDLLALREQYPIETRAEFVRRL